MVPRERTTFGDLPVINEQRNAVNAWLRSEAEVAGVIAKPHNFIPGYGEDGIHPSAEGHRVMSEVAGRTVSSAVGGNMTE